MYIIGVDIGGTNIKCGLIFNGDIVDSKIVATNTFDVIRQVENIVREIIESNNLTLEDITGVGIGYPGIVVNGVIVSSANLGLRDCNLEDILKESLNLPVKVLNDGDMATLAEYKLGAGANSLNMIMLTLGTGVGGGIILNGDLYVGNGGGELGHVLFEKNGIPCNCGRYGCVEKYISYKALSDNAKKLMETMANNIPYTEPFIKAENLIKCMKDGDACAKLILDKYIEDLCEGILNYCNIFRPDKIVIGGGLSYCKEIIEMVAKKCKEKNYGYIGSPSVEIVPAKLSNDAGILGASLLF